MYKPSRSVRYVVVWGARARASAARVAELATHSIRIPAGIEDGMRIRVAGAGNIGERGAPSGDLYIRVRVGEDLELIRDGDDLIHRMRINFVEASLGTEVEV